MILTVILSGQVARASAVYSAATRLAQLTGRASAYIQHRRRLVGLAEHGGVLGLLGVAALDSRADVAFSDVCVSELVQE